MMWVCGGPSLQGLFFHITMEGKVQVFQRNCEGYQLQNGSDNKISLSNFGENLTTVGGGISR